jgi:hypothetical protein
MSNQARTRNEDREKTRKTLALLRYCACRKRVKRFRRVLTGIEKAKAGRKSR